ncbi:MAG TPA: hypothetical protein VJW20_22805 [Candidatus Angelobacter sp.]|nr:hypothetical protein [Candidatus Angelobacter sp.]
MNSKVKCRQHALRYTLIVLLFSSLWIFGCKQSEGNRDGVLISAKFPLYSYVHARLNEHSGEHLNFPLLAIYDRSGVLIYSGYDVSENVQLLEDLPGKISNLQSKPGAASLAAAIEEIPDFRARKTEILNSRKNTVVSTFLQECDACSFQEEALQNAERQLLKNGINVLVIHLLKPQR